MNDENKITDFQKLVPSSENVGTQKRNETVKESNPSRTFERREFKTEKGSGDRNRSSRGFREQSQGGGRGSRGDARGGQQQNRNNDRPQKQYPQRENRVFSFFGSRDKGQNAQGPRRAFQTITPTLPVRNNDPLGIQKDPLEIKIALERKTYDKEGKLKLLPLGGIGNVNKNMYVYEYGDDIVLVDCGIGFPEDDMLGVDFLIPDISYLRGKQDKIRALVITHGHDDHIGAISLLWKELQCPIYASKITCGFIKVKLAEHGLNTDMLNEINLDDKYTFGSFSAQFVRLSHSIPDTVAVALDTPIGRVIHSADFKFDWTPTVGAPTDVQKLAALGYEGVSLLLSDSLGSEKPGYTLSERIIEPQLHEVARVTKGKIIVTTTSSNISRIQMAMNVALAHGRKVAVSGRSMDQNIGVARNLGYLTFPEDSFIELEQIGHYADQELMLIVAGSQGQAESSLARAAYDDHRHITIKPGDSIVFSTDPIPGNENQTNRLIDQLFKRGAEVYYSHVFDKLHVSGHAAQEELKLMIGLVKPEALLPIGGTERSTQKYVDLARDLGYEQNRVYTPQNGEQMVFYRDENGFFKGHVEQRLELQSIMVDGLGVGDLTDIVLRDRQVMSSEGILLVIVPVDNQTKEVSGAVELVSRGFVVMKESKELVDQLTAVVEELVEPFRSKPFDWQLMRKRIDDRLSKYIYKELHRKPMVLPVLFEV